MDYFSSHSSTAFWACMRLPACWKTALAGPSITSSVISSPRCAGRQCSTLHVRRRLRQQRRVHLERRELLAGVPRARPPGPCSSRRRCRSRPRSSRRPRGSFTSFGKSGETFARVVRLELVVEAVALRAREDELRAELAAPDRERARDVVAVADERDRPALLACRTVRERSAGRPVPGTGATSPTAR